MLASLVDVDCRFAYLNDPRVTAWHPDGRLRVISERGNESGIVSTVLAIAIDPNRILTNRGDRSLNLSTSTAQHAVDLW